MLTGVVLLAAGCGGSEGNSDPTAVVPHDAVFYVEVDVEPDGAEREGLDSILERIPGDDGPAELVDAILEESELKLDFEEDVDPWLGERIGAFASRFSSEADLTDGAVVFSSDDAERAEDALGDVFGSRDGSYADVDYWEEDDAVAGMVDDLVVVGTKEAFEDAVDASEERTLADTRGFKDWREGLPDEWTAAVYWGDVTKLVGPGLAAPGLTNFLSGLSGQSATLRLREHGIVIDGQVPAKLALFASFPFGAGTPMVRHASSDTWFAVGVPDLGTSVRNLGQLFGGIGGPRFEREINKEIRKEIGLGLDELLGWMGDATIFTNGTLEDPYSGALVIRVTDRAAAARAFDAVVSAVDTGTYRLRPLPLPSKRGLEGYELTGPDLPVPIEVVRSHRHVVVALGLAMGFAAERLTTPGARAFYGSLGDEDGFRTAFRTLGKGFEPASYLDVSQLLAIIEYRAGLTDDRDYRKAKPYLQILDRVASGTRRVDRKNLAVRTLITLK